MSHKDIETAFKSGTIKAAVIFPAQMADDLAHLGSAQIQIIADASDPNTATALTFYINSIISSYQKEISVTQKCPTKSYLRSECFTTQSLKVQQILYRE